MTIFRIWAPEAKKVVLCVNDREYTMQVFENGFWQIEINSLKAPILYAFKVDEKGPFPDPASQFQPNGVHGWSQLWCEPFIWNDADCKVPELKNAVLYELHVGTYTSEGTFAGIQQKLDYLVELGITHIELLPVAAFPGCRGWGYDGVDLYASHQSYGTPTQLKELVNACHLRGLAIILDVVYNHLGPDGNYLGQFAPYFSKKYQSQWGEAVNFDGDHSDQVREFMINNAMMWLRDFHFDGLRLDAVHGIYDFSATHILEEMQSHVNELTKITGRKLFLIAESDLNNPRLLRSHENGGFGMAAQWLDDFHHSLHVMLTGEKQGYYQDFSGPEDFNKCLQKAYVYDGRYSTFRKRRHGREAANLPPENFVVFAQNHDQVGNRGFGERLCHLVSFEHCQIAAALLLLSPFIPMLFQGEEWAASSPFLYFTDHTDPNLAEAVRTGRQRDYSFLSETVPDPQAPTTFTRSVLKWPEASQDKHAVMLDWHKQLIRIRSKYLGNIRSELPFLKIINADQKLYLYSAGNLRLLINAGEESGCFEAPGLSSARILLQNKNLEIDAAGLVTAPGTAALLLMNE